MGTPRTKAKTFKFEAIGTQWEIETDAPLDTQLQIRILDRVHEFDRIYSRFRHDSLVSRLAGANEGGCFDFPDDAPALFDLYDQLHTLTNGAIDPLVGRTLELLGYDRAYSLKAATDDVQRNAHAQRPVWSKDVIRHGARLRTRRPLVIDVGAAGKGHLVDIVTRLLRHAGFRQFVVDGGGDLRNTGDSNLRIGLEHPFSPGQVIGVVNLRDRALCASAVNRRAWGHGLHHVLDARTGIPVRDVVASWVVADSALLADGLATALFFVPARRLAEAFNFTYVRMYSNGRAEMSPTFDGEIFTRSKHETNLTS
jgi:FAD:protein FMN transferase